MRLGEFLFGQKVEIALDCSPAECEASLRAALPRHQWPSIRRGIKGYVSPRWVVLRYRTGVFERRYAPELSAAICAGPGGAVLRGKFGLTPPLAAGAVMLMGAPIFLLGWLGLAALTGRSPPVLLLPGLAFAVIFWGFILRDAWAADRDWDEILVMLDETCGLV